MSTERTSAGPAAPDGFEFFDTPGREGPDGRDGAEVMPSEITCVDCGGRAHLITIVTEEQPLLPGQIATYRCSDCRDRWDIVVPGGPDDDEDETDERGW